jgi:hypothetical protein
LDLPGDGGERLDRSSGWAALDFWPAEEVCEELVRRRWRYWRSVHVVHRNCVHVYAVEREPLAVLLREGLKLPYFHDGKPHELQSAAAKLGVPYRAVVVLPQFQHVVNKGRIPRRTIYTGAHSLLLPLIVR